MREISVSHMSPNRGNLQKVNKGIMINFDNCVVYHTREDEKIWEQERIYKKITSIGAETVTAIKYQRYCEQMSTNWLKQCLASPSEQMSAWHIAIIEGVINERL